MSDHGRADASDSWALSGLEEVSAEELLRRGIAENGRGRLRNARRILARALLSAGDDALRARISAPLAYAMGELGDASGAELLCRTALGLPELPPAIRGILSGQLGTLVLHRGGVDASLALFRTAVALVEDPAARANVLLNHGVALLQRRRLRECADEFAAAAELFAELGDAAGEAQARHNLGYTALLAGDLVLALTEMNAARDELGRESPMAAAISDLDRAEALREAGQLHESEELLEQAAHAFGRLRRPQTRGEAELQLAQTLLGHDPARAAQVAARAGQRFRALGSESWAVRADGVRLRALLAPTGDRTSTKPVPPELEAACARTSRKLSRFGFRVEARALGYVRDAALARSGHPPRRAPRLDPDDPLSVRVLAHEARAARSAALGRDADARRHAAEGIREVSAWQRSFGSLDILSSVAIHGSGVFAEGIAAGIRSGRPEVVFEWSEYARHFTQQVSPVRPPQDPRHAADLAQLRALRAEIGTADWADDSRVVALRRRVSERQWVGTSSTDGPPSLGLEEFRDLLDDDTVLLSYVYARGRLTCLVVPRTAPPALVDLSWRAVRDLRDGLHTELNAAAATHGGRAGRLIREALERRLARLSQALVEEPMRIASHARRVLITVPGELQGTPWGMLPALRGRVITNVRSASRWAHGSRVPFALQRAGFVVGPRVARGVEEAQSGARPWWIEAERRARGSGGDAVHVLADGAARVEHATALAEEVDVLHVVAHGRHSADSPLLSGFELADGTLFGYDIDAIAEAPDLVVLSACELGRSSVRWGEEAIGMARAWLHAGSRCVIAAPVTVADDVACELLSVMHEGLAARLDPAEALAAAAAETGHDSPFLCYGSGF
ncbi:CHAT domain-containing protein [Microbacterium oryzae]|uniref:CHAT domain-containing protein n=1 Tax=Microbacterium oryzae TaxID=743009 RepID=UPI0025B11103|nr:CHAT domain-containing protein [Microbacterium oryzae]MDN3310103.1 CHAT domain-containing protein [Microbacterium oryzae]